MTNLAVESADLFQRRELASQAREMIAPYVEKDPTKFCTYEEFEKGVETLSVFCNLRSQSVSVQLSGQNANVDASSITLSDMGTMNRGFGGMGQRPGMSENSNNAQIPTMPDNASGSGSSQMPQMPGQFGGFGGQGGMTPPDGMEIPDGMEMPEGMENMFPGQNGNSQESFPDRGQANTAATQVSNQWIQLAITIVVLAAGLMFAFKFKR